MTNNFVRRSYNDIAAYYDKYAYWFRNDSPSSGISTFNKIMKKFKVKTILDLCCGTGYPILQLSQKGYRCVGNDLSEGMLNVAKRKAKNLEADIHFLNQDCRKLSLDTKFDCIILINALPHISPRSYKKLFEKVYKHLTDDGIFIIEPVTKDDFMKENPSFVFGTRNIETQTHPKSQKEIVTFFYFHDYKKNHCTFTYHILMMPHKGNLYRKGYKHMSFDWKFHLVTEVELLDALSNCFDSNRFLRDDYNDGAKSPLLICPK